MMEAIEESPEEMSEEDIEEEITNIIFDAFPEEMSDDEQYIAWEQAEKAAKEIMKKFKVIPKKKEDEEK